MLAFAFLALPAQANAQWASAFAGTCVCGAGSGTFASPLVDAVSVSSAWQPANVSVALPASGGADTYDWKLDCLSPSATSGTTPAGGTVLVSGNGTHTFTHRAHDPVSGNSTDWVDETVNIDAGSPVNSSSTSTAWRRGPVTAPLSVADSVSPVHGEWKVDGAASYTLGSTATVGDATP